jgi:hypothetical protein
MVYNPQSSVRTSQAAAGQHSYTPAQMPTTGLMAEEDYFRMEAFFDLQLGRVTGASSNAKALTGYAFDFLIGRTAPELLLLLPHEDQTVVASISKEAGKFLRNLPYGSILSARLSFIVRYVIARDVQKWLRITARPKANEYGMIHSYKIDIYDASDELSGKPQIQGSIAYLDPFGGNSYHRFAQETRIQADLNPRELKVNLSKDTVDKSRKQMLLKTGAKNTVELVSRFVIQ